MCLHTWAEESVQSVRMVVVDDSELVAARMDADEEEEDGIHHHQQPVEAVECSLREENSTETKWLAHHSNRNSSMFSHCSDMYKISPRHTILQMLWQAKSQNSM